MLALLKGHSGDMQLGSEEGSILSLSGGPAYRSSKTSRKHLLKEENSSLLG